jgi:hypothetical protein
MSRNYNYLGAEPSLTPPDFYDTDCPYEAEARELWNEWMDKRTGLIAEALSECGEEVEAYFIAHKTAQLKAQAGAE